MFFSKGNKERERYYLLPGQGGPAARRKQKIFEMVNRGVPDFLRAHGVGHVLVQPRAAVLMQWRRLTRRRQLLVFASNLMNGSRLISIWAAAFCLSLPLRAELADGVKAIVNNTVITYEQVEEFTVPAMDALRRQYAAQPEVFQQKLAEALDNSLEILVERQLILHEFEAKYTKLPDSVVDELVQDRIREQFGDRVTAMKSLQAQGMTYEQFREDIRDQYIESALRNHEHLAGNRHLALQSGNLLPGPPGRFQG